MTNKKMISTSEVTVSGNSLESTPATILEMAVQQGANVEQLSKLMELKERWEQGEARKAYHKAMASFKTNAPTIKKDKHVSYGEGKTSYNHATLANVCKTINSELSKHGLSATWSPSQNGHISVTCRITHELGHFEETTLSAPSDTTGSKNPIQAIGSTITYLERYTLLALTGLATEDQDDDGVKSEPVNCIDDKQLSVILDYIKSLKVSEASFLKAFKIDAIEKLPKSQYQRAITAFKTKEANK